MALSLLLEPETTAIRDTSHGFRADEKCARNGTLPDSYVVRVAESAGESSPTRHYQLSSDATDRYLGGSAVCGFDMLPVIPWRIPR